jgi:putative ABC transport system permease protein
MRGELPRSKNIPYRLFYLERLSNWFSQAFFLKYALRDLLRRRNLTLVTIASISLALAIAVSFRIFTTSINGTVRHFYDQDQWNLIIDFRTAMDTEDIQNTLPQGLIERYEGYLKGMGVIEVDGERSFGQIIGVEPGSRMRKMEFVEGRDFSDTNTFEVILNRNLWKEKPLKLGQEIYIETTNGKYKMHLVGVLDEATLGIEYAYLPIKTVQKLLNQDGRYTGIWATSRYSSDYAKKILYRNEMISMVTPKKDIDKIIDQFIVSLRASIRTMLTIAMLLAPFFLLTGMGLSILEKERDFIILRTMGSKKKEILKILMTEALIVGTLGILLSIPLAILMGIMQNKMASDIYCTIRTYVRPSDYIYVLLCFPLFPLVACIFSRRISGLNIVQKLMARMG